MKKDKRIELLCPAKNLETGIAAILHGADAVYTGAPRFGARRAAGNSVSDIEKLVEFAHRYYASVYITLNTVLFDDEIEDVHRLTVALYNAGVDALIVQDMAFFEMDLPPLPLHMSTQCHNTDIERVKFFEDAGAERVILARELSLNEIKNIRKETSIRLEAFVHGALCVCYSGQCYMSLAAGGRSANRGDCAQPCRKKYSLWHPGGKEIIRDKHLLCLKDMNRSDSLEEMIDAGITSFKIEGRLKDISYVKNITAFYRKKIDRILEQRDDLSKSSSGNTRIFFEPDPQKTFNRGYTDYFFPECRKIMFSPLTPKSIGAEAGRVVFRGKNRIEVESSLDFCNGDGFCFFDEKDELLGFRAERVDERTIYASLPDELRKGDFVYRNHDASFVTMLKGKTSERKVQIDAFITDTENGLEVTFSDEDGNSVKQVITCERQEATDRERAYEIIKKSLARLGDTIFELRDLSVEMNPFFSIRPSDLNSTRRQLSELLLIKRLDKYLLQRIKREKKYPQYIKNITSDYNVTNALAEKFYTEILQIQYGLKEDPFGWRVKILDGGKNKKR